MPFEQPKASHLKAVKGIPAWGFDMITVIHAKYMYLAALYPSHRHFLEVQYQESSERIHVQRVQTDIPDGS